MLATRAGSREFQASSAIRTLHTAESRVKGGKGGREVFVLVFMM